MPDLDQYSLTHIQWILPLHALLQDVPRHGKMRQTVVFLSGKGTVLGPFAAGSCPGNAQDGVEEGVARMQP